MFSIWRLCIIGVFLGCSSTLVVSQEIEIDTSTFEQKFPEKKYLFQLTQIERVLNELELTEEQKKELDRIEIQLAPKHEKLAKQVRRLRDDDLKDQEKVSVIHEAFFKDIGPELAGIKKLLTKTQTTRLRQIAFQFYFVMKYRVNQEIDGRHILLTPEVSSGLGLTTMQLEVIKSIYETMQADLSKLESENSDRHKTVLANAHKQILETLEPEQLNLVNEIIGLPAQSLNL